MAFPPGFLDELRSRIGLSELIGRDVKLTRRGREFVGLCPFHNEKTPSFTVNEDKGFFHCFGCGANGDVIGFVMQRKRLSFPETVAALAAEAGLEVPEATPAERRERERRAGLLEVMEAACAFFEATLRGPDGAAARDYLAGRGLGPATVARFRLGFAPAGNRLKVALAGPAMPEDALLECGLLRRPDDGRPSRDFFFDRVVFPIADRRDRVIAFGGRALGDGQPKYLNSPDTPLFDKRRTLYGLAGARDAARRNGRVLVVEGYMDVISLAQAGLVETVAPLGTALTDSHLDELWRLAGEAGEPVLCFDGDEAGRRAALRVAERALPQLAPDRSLAFVGLPAGEDPDSLVRAGGAAVLEALVAKAEPLAEVLWRKELEGRRLDTPERLAGLERRFENLASAIADRQVQYRYREHFRRRLRELTRWPGRAGARPAAVSALRAGHGAAALGRRGEQVLVTALVNHPWLVDECAETLAQVELADAGIGGLLREALAICAECPDIDSATLRNQITERGQGVVLKALPETEILVHAGFARADAPPEAVREGVGEVLGHVLRAVRQREARRARDDFVNDPTDENWRRFGVLRAEAVATPAASE